MTKETIDAIGFINQAKTERSKFLTQVLGTALSAVFKALKPAASKAAKPANVHLPHAA